MLKHIAITVLQWILSLRYHVIVHQTLPVQRKGSSGVLFLANHPALIDPIIVMSRLFNAYRPRPLADETQMNRPGLKHLFKLVNPVLIPDVKTDGTNARHRAKAAIENVIDALLQGDNILLYPAGRIYRSKDEYLGANSAVETILQQVPDVSVVLVRTSGLWGSAFSHASGNAPRLRRIFPKAILALLGAGLFFLPRRRVFLEITPKPDFPKFNGRLHMNRFMESFFNHTSHDAQHVPYTLFTKSAINHPAPDSFEDSKAEKPTTGSCSTMQPLETADIASHATDDQKRTLHSFLMSHLQVSDIFAPQSLSMDLGMDSILKMELALWIEQTFHTNPINVEHLETVADCYRAINGEAQEKAPAKSTVFPDARWNTPTDAKPLHAFDGNTIAQLVLRQAMTRPNHPIIADPMRGTLTYRQLLTAVFALKPHVEKLSGSHLGIMLPASNAAVVAYLTCMFAGKTPVMFNFTAGQKAVAHGVSTTGVQHILTSTLFLQKLKSKGEDLTKPGANMVPLENLAKQISLAGKLRAVWQSRFGLQHSMRAPISPVAAVLFTSGSETLPKAVPLTHRNIIANFYAFSNRLHLRGTDRLLGILPPFHSFGLTGNIVMPLCMGLPTVYMSNPTESVTLARTVETAGITCLLATPTFLNGMLQQPARLESIRLTFVGAEKCPGAVYRQFAQKCPKGVLCEGYGITECAPVISMNSVENPVLETIGTVLPGISHAIVNDAMDTRVAVGETGTLLVRGDNVFSGYLGAADSPFVQFENQEWYNTGDMVSAQSDGTLVFKGRKKRFIKVGGEMISLPAIETVLQQSDFFKENKGEGAITTTRPESRQLVLIATTDVPVETANEILRSSGLSSLHRISRVVRVDNLPKLGSGKINYRELTQIAAVQPAA
ncbi:MAG: AMP-binding protein [Deltaproteobacteria bacterium]|nr:AMP-binding protein [Deltaproteobacteria bacterium]